jgi:hypothetical protein
MGRHDDETILPEWTLGRGIRPDWFENDENGKEVIQSRAFDESNQEVSCFILEETDGAEGFQRDILPIIEKELEERLRFATVGVRFARACGFWIYRKPEEFHNNRAHVVLCPQQTENISRKQFKRQAREIARKAVPYPV